MQRYPTATITELPSETDAAPANAEVTEETEEAVEGEDFLSPMADCVGGHGYMANVAQVGCQIAIPKMRECCRQVEVEEVRNSRLGAKFTKPGNSNLVQL